jgi:hypothetical protein
LRPAGEQAVAQFRFIHSDAGHGAFHKSSTGSSGIDDPAGSSRGRTYGKPRRGALSTTGLINSFQVRSGGRSELRVLGRRRGF